MAIEYPQAPNISPPTSKPYTPPSNMTSDTFNLDNSNTGYDSPNFQLQTQNLDTSNTGLLSQPNMPTFNDGQSYVSDKSLAVKQAGDLVKKGSMLYDIGESKGLSQAAGRGMQNSDIGVETAVRGGFAEIMPAVLNDSQLRGSADLAKQQFEGNAGLKDFEAQSAGAAAEQGANIQGALNTQTAGYHTELERQRNVLAGAGREQEGNIKGALLTQQNQYQQSDAKLAALLQGASDMQTWDNKFAEQVFQAQQQAMRDRMNLEFNELIQGNSVTLEEEKALSDSYMEMSKNYEISVQNILLDPNLDGTAKTAAIQRIQKIFDSDMSNIAGIFSADYTPGTPYQGTT